MKLQRADLERAEQAGVLNAGQGEALWGFLAHAGHADDVAQFRFAHVLYYLGGMIAIAAMSLFMSVSYSQWGAWSLTVFGAGYAFIAWRLGAWFLDRKHLPIPAGILFTLAIVLVPVAVYGIEAGLGHWPSGGRVSDYHVYIDWRWVFLDLSTLLAAAIFLWRYRLPFMTMPVAVTLWYISMDLAAWIIFGIAQVGAEADWERDWLLRKWVSVGFGTLMLVLALVIDLRSRRARGDYAFWLYLFGLLAFWGGLSSMDSDSEVGKFIYCLINVSLILTGAILARRAFPVFGGMGLTFYLGHLAYTVFPDSLTFSFALSVLGLLVVFAGVWWGRHGDALGDRMRLALSPQLAELIQLRKS
ncbi:MAG: DUF2157 domain-containing protein [Burkholderiales bacterium]|nr:DUF2157 domain-containing protein [Burkholderiales bacterium]